MKKVLLTICLAAAAFTVFAQSQQTFGIRAGANFATLSSSGEGSSSTYSTGTFTTFSGGLFGDFQVSEAVSIQPAINFTGKGGKEAEDGLTLKAKLYYIQVPVNVVYNAPVKGGKFYFGAGPYVAVGVSAKATLSDGSQSQTYDLGFGDSDGEYKRVDAGADFIAGFQFTQGYIIHLNYDLGLTNISNINGLSTKNRVFGVSIGHTF